MNLITFDPLRTFDISSAVTVKPEAWLRHIDQLRTADWVLFPEYWQVSTLLYGLRTKIFPSPSSYFLGYSKVEMTYAFQTLFPAHVPDTLILPSTDRNREQVLDEFRFPFVGKEVRSSRGKGVHLIESRQEFAEYARNNSMLYVQERLPIDRDLRVVVVGQEVLTAYWRIAPEGGFHNNVAQGSEVSFEGVPQAAIDLVVRVAAALRIDHAGFDVALVDGHPFLFEFNMRFGNDALRKEGIRLGPKILAYLEEEQGRAAVPSIPTV